MGSNESKEQEQQRVQAQPRCSDAPHYLALVMKALLGTNEYSAISMATLLRRVRRQLTDRQNEANVNMHVKRALGSAMVHGLVLFKSMKFYCAQISECSSRTNLRANFDNATRPNRSWFTTTGFTMTVGPLRQVVAICANCMEQEERQASTRTSNVGSNEMIQHRKELVKRNSSASSYQSIDEPKRQRLDFKREYDKEDEETESEQEE